jgi:hypothetical protein
VKLRLPTPLIAYRPQVNKSIAATMSKQIRWQQISIYIYIYVYVYRYTLRLGVKNESGTESKKSFIIDNCRE